MCVKNRKFLYDRVVGKPFTNNLILSIKSNCTLLLYTVKKTNTDIKIIEF